MTDERARISDPAVMRALAHPARLALLEHLMFHEDGGTATECAQVVGLSPSATSYHLRAMAKVSLIEEAPSRGDGRERVWQGRFRNYSIGTDRDSGPEEIAAGAAMAEAMLAHQNEKVRRFLVHAEDKHDEWYEAAVMHDQTLVLTAEELTALVGRIDELTKPYLRRERKDPPDGARFVSFQLRAVPFDPVP